MKLKKNIRTFVSGTVALLINVAVVFNLGFSAFHAAFAAHGHPEAKVCTADEENDACHRFTVHHEKSNECNGAHQHINTENKECFICKFYKTFSFYVQWPGNNSIPAQHTLTNLFSYTAEFPSSFVYDIFSRGPPFPVNCIA